MLSFWYPLGTLFAYPKKTSSALEWAEWLSCMSAADLNTLH